MRKVLKKVQPLHHPPDCRPTHLGFHLGQAHQQQRQPTNQNMGADAIVF
jgi:hypothetical protein